MCEKIINASGRVLYCADFYESVIHKLCYKISNTTLAESTLELVLKSNMMFYEVV